MPVINTDAVLWYNVGQFGQLGYGVPNPSDDPGSLNPAILDLVSLTGRNLFHIMHHEDVDLRVPPSINTIRRVHKLYIRLGQILQARAVPSGENNMETQHVQPAGEVFKVYPVPFFKVRNPFLLRGLWLSGLRISEAMCLTWDQWGEGIRVDVSGKYVKLLIPSESEKGGKDRVYPVTPDFAEFLLAVPKSERSGHVFKLIAGRGLTTNPATAMRIIGKLGKASGVKVDERRKKDKVTGKTMTVPVWGSAHDLRRAFGSRWAKRVMPMVLKELMRHESVTTTEKFYLGIDADGTAELLAGLMPQGDTLGDTSPRESIRDDSA